MDWRTFKPPRGRPGAGRSKSVTTKSLRVCCFRNRYNLSGFESGGAGELPSKPVTLASHDEEIDRITNKIVVATTASLLPRVGAEVVQTAVNAARTIKGELKEAILEWAPHKFDLSQTCPSSTATNEGATDTDGSSGEGGADAWSLDGLGIRGSDASLEAVLKGVGCPATSCLTLAHVAAAK